MAVRLCVPVGISAAELREVQARTALRYALARDCRKMEERSSTVSLEAVRILRAAERKAKSLHDAWCSAVPSGEVA